MTKTKEVRQIARRMFEIGYSTTDIATAIGVHRSTVHRWRVNDWSHHVMPRSRKLSCDDEAFLCRQMCEARPCLRQRDVVEICKREKGASISQSYVCRMLRRHAITRKRATKRYDQQDMLQVAAFVDALPDEARTSWWSMDECGFLFNQAPAYAYERKGRRAVVSRPGPRGKRVSLMLCISPQGLVGHRWLWGGVKSVHFRDFIEALPGSGTMLLDNASIHKAAARSTRHRLMFLPPYSPQLNPVELCFNVLKSTTRRSCIRTFEGLTVEVERCLRTMDMSGFFRSCFPILRG